MMSRKAIGVDVDPAVFKWLRVSSGWTIEEIANKLKISLENAKRIETGEKKPTLAQLKRLSMAYKRPLAAFLLSKPMKEKPMPKDYRLLPGKLNQFDKGTIAVLRKSRHLQEIGKELSRNIEYQIKPKVRRARVSDNPENIAKRYREMFGLSEGKQRDLKTPYELFNYLRDVLEDMNIMVLRFSMPVEDARGFALVDDLPNTIVVNSKDSIEARIFSLMHEFAHILLGESVIDLPDVLTRTRNRIETWCNHFSAEFLLPMEMSRRLFESKKGMLTQTRTLNSLSSRYKISKAMLLFNMKKLRYITKKEYDKVLDRYTPTDPGSKAKDRTKGGGMSSEKRCISEVGVKFISIVARNYDRKFITYTDALNYLSIKSKNFDRVLARATK